MDHKKLVLIVSQCQPLWDRSHDKFRDQGYKANLWNKVGTELNSTGPLCREAFKALREKYIREREKLSHFGSSYRQWELLDYMHFLDPYIITRKATQSWSTMHSDDVTSIKEDPSADTDENHHDELDAKDMNSFGMDLTTSDFYKTLIRLVRESKALWDRRNKDNHDKIVKDKLWKTIAHTLKTDVNTCILRWKGLREKYIRQKQKYTDGEAKWEFLDELSFLDYVIQYRKKHWQIEESSNMYITNDNSCALSQANSDYETMDDRTNDSIRNQPSSSTNSSQPCTTSHPSMNNVNLKLYTPDSSLDTMNSSFSRKRTLSDDSESSYSKKEKSDTSDRTPEQIFGEFVAAMLANKSGPNKNIAMMEIMSILARPST